MLSNSSDEVFPLLVGSSSVPIQIVWRIAFPRPPAAGQVIAVRGRPLRCSTERIQQTGFAEFVCIAEPLVQHGPIVYPGRGVDLRPGGGTVPQSESAKRYCRPGRTPR